jgi:hypothetical protein
MQEHGTEIDGRRAEPGVARYARKLAPVYAAVGPTMHPRLRTGPLGADKESTSPHPKDRVCAMKDTEPGPPLRPLHSEGILIQVKLDTFRALETRALVESLRPGMPGSLKTRPDGTMLDGHHRIAVLKARGLAVDTLPREVIEKRNNGSDAP